MSAPSAATLAACAAVLIAPNDSDTATLKLLAEAVGFGTALDFRAPGSASLTQLPYYLLHPAVPDLGKARFIKAIRSSEDPRKKFAPIILFLPRGPAHQALFYIEMGFDDVLFMSDPVGALQGKLLQQLGQEVMFVQTGNYLGPDRRRMERIRREDPRRKPGGSVHRRFAVIRDPQTGLRVQDRPERRL